MDRPRRNVPRHNYRNLHLFGFGDDPVEEFSDDEGEEHDSDDEDEHHQELGSDEEEELNEEDLFDEQEDDEVDVDDIELDDEILPNLFTASDGTVWYPEPIITDENDPIEPYGEPARLKPAARNAMNMYDFYSLMLSPDNDGVLWSICYWNNQHARPIVDEFIRTHPRTKVKPWKVLTVVELNAFFGLVLLAGIEKGVHQPSHEFWSKDETIRRHPFPATMSRNRFKSIMRFLRFDDVQERKARDAARKTAAQAVPPGAPTFAMPPAKDNFEPIRELSTRITDSFYHLLEPGQTLVVDEQIVRFKGRCSFRVYTKSKPGKYGIKLWVVVDLETGFILDIQPYLGKEGGRREVDQGKRVVLDLVGVYAGSGRNVTADNFFSSLKLCAELREMNLTYLGTIRPSRKEIPDDVRDIRDVAVGYSQSFFHPESRTMLMKYKPRQNKGVFIISSGSYTVEVGEVDEELAKPPLVDRYNQEKVGVDVADQMLATYYALFPTERWPVRHILHKVQLVAYNAFKLFILKFPNWRRNDRSRRRVALRDLVRLLIVPHILRRRRNLNGIQMQVRRSMDLVLNVPAVPAPQGPNLPVFPPLRPEEDQNINAAPFRREPGTARDPDRLRVRCEICTGTSRQRKVTDVQCCRCNSFICGDHRDTWCHNCTNARYR